MLSRPVSSIQVSDIGLLTEAFCGISLSFEMETVLDARLPVSGICLGRLPGYG